MALAGLTHQAWAERVPDLVAACIDRWELTLGDAYDAGVAGYVVRADLADGTPAVLKLIFPHREGEHEAAALSLWDGDAAVRLFDYDEDRWAMLIERCEPGTRLAASASDTVLSVMAELLPRLWKPAGQPFHSLADEVQWWTDYLPDEWAQAGRPFERRLLDAVLDVLPALAASQREQVLLHQDLHGDNVLAAQREPWLVIDPKPVVGEREFALAPVARDFELGHTRRDVHYRLDRLSSELDLDRERARWWTIGQSVAWFWLDGTIIHRNLDVARWLFEDA